MKTRTLERFGPLWTALEFAVIAAVPANLAGFRNQPA
jgi:hypothetical protein